MHYRTGPFAAPPRYAPIPRAIEILGIGRSKIYGLAGEGHLRLIKVGTRTLVDVEHALAWIATLPPAKIAAPRQAEAA